MMITIDRAVVEQALEMLELLEKDVEWQIGSPTLSALRKSMKSLHAALAQKHAALAQEQADLSRCPQCGGPADNGHDRQLPPNPYWCTRCVASAKDDWK